MDTPTMMLSVLEHLAAAEADMQSESREHLTSAISSLSSAFDLSLDNPKQVSAQQLFLVSSMFWMLLKVAWLKVMPKVL